MAENANECPPGDIPSNYHCEMGILSRPHGSAMLNQGGTIMIAAIYGPLEARPHKMSIDKSIVETYYRPKVGFPGVTNRQKESLIRNTCETVFLSALYPRTAISVVIQEVVNGGQMIACSVNAACLALLNAGIEMKCLVGAICCVIDEEDNINIYSPNTNEETIKAHFTLVFDSNNKQIVSASTAGSFSDPQYAYAVEICREASGDLFNFYRKIMSKEILRNNAN